MARHPSQLLNPVMAELEEYTPIQPFEVLSRELDIPSERIVKLDANENPYGPPQVVLDALAEYPYYHIYPDPQQTELREAIARRYGVPFDQLVVGSGADELLDYICRMFLAAGDAIVDLPPTFGMYTFDARLVGAAVHSVPRREDYTIDVDAVARTVRDAQEAGQSPVKLVFATSPNNPTGTWMEDRELERLLELPTMVVLDEAYVDFAHRPSRLDWVIRHDNLIVLRTFSKALGIAGLRLGFGVFPEWLLPTFWKFKQPYNVTAAAMAAGIASLAHYEVIEDVTRRMRAGRDHLFQELTAISFLRPYPSQGNFVLCRVVEGDAHAIWRRLRTQGILVRYYNKPMLEDCLRFSVGRGEQVRRLIDALRGMEGQV